VQSAARLKEAQKLGFLRAIIPAAARPETGFDGVMTLEPVAALADLVATIAARAPASLRQARSASGASARQQDR
jgi:DNA repair protein RadA/Sms